MMLQTISSALLWGAVLNYGVLLIWFLGFSLMHDPLYRLHRRWFALPIERFDAIHYTGMAGYKIAILLFFLVPWLALALAG
ncbi:MAG TPA: hypothetical protein VD885_06355 [Methylophilaceae bacterium]|nr:hypothetical protein [Methylophilaceae bacterium]